MTHEELNAAYAEADKRMKDGNGHRFVTILKTRCEYCGRKPGVKNRCSGWFQSFLSHLHEVLMERGHINR